MKFSAVTAALLIALAVPATSVSAQDNGTASSAGQRTSMSGIFSQRQASAGRNVYSMQCSACHSTSAHSGTAFMKSWQGRSVWDLFSFLKDNMPQSDPGGLSDQEYIQVVTYMLSLNRMPAGESDLPADPAMLRSIRIDTTAVSSSASAPPRR